MDKKKKLTVKQKNFINEYLVDFNASKAALRAGYSEHTAFRIGQENLHKPTIMQEISKSIDARQNRTKITADYVLNGFREIAERCLVPRTDRDGNVSIDSAGASRAFENLAKYLHMYDKDESEDNVLEISWLQPETNGEPNKLTIKRKQEPLALSDPEPGDD